MRPNPDGPRRRVAMIGSRGLLVRHSGLETHVRELSRHLAMLGHQVTVYGRAGGKLDRMAPESLAEPLLRAVDGPCLKGKFSATVSNSIWATCAALRSGQYNILHYHGIGCVFAILLARRAGLPIVLTLHSTNWQEDKWGHFSKALIHRLEKAAVRSADAVIAVSQDIAARTLDEYGIAPTVIPNGVRIMGKAEWDGDVLRSFGLAEGSYVLYVGRIVPDKGCHVLLDAFLSADLPMKLVFAGLAPDKPYAEKLAATSSEAVIFTGSLQERELGALYRNCAVCCSASVSEGQPIVLLEALAHGATCMVSEIPAHRELVADPRLRFPVGDASTLCERLIRTCTQEPCRRTTDPCCNWLDLHPEFHLGNVAKRVEVVYGRAEL